MGSRRGRRTGGERSGRRSALWIPVLIWALLVALSAGAWAWTGWMQHAEVDKGFAARSVASADFAGSYLLGTAMRQQTDARRLLAGRTVTEREIDLFRAGFCYAAFSLFDDRGHRLLTAPPISARERRRVPTPPAVRAAIRHGRVVVSDVRWSLLLERPSVAIAIPFQTPYGRRVLNGGFMVSECPLSDFVRQAVAPTSGARAVLVDGVGMIVASTGGLEAEITPLARTEPALAEMLRRHPSFGGYREEGEAWTYASSPVRAANWRLIITVPDRQLYAEVDGALRRSGAALAVAALLGLLGAVSVGAATRRRREAERSLRRLTTDLEVANAELDAFSASVAHDLRAPLTVISAISDILLDADSDKLPAKEAADLLGRIRTNAVKMNDLITSLLSFARLQRRQLITQTVDMDQVTRNAWETLAALRADRDIDLQIDKLPPCEGDPVLLQQVMLNLLSNAVKFTRDRRTAHIQVGSRPGPEGMVTYLVEDNGIGFDPEHADKLFQPFQRLNSAEGFHGIGMGLNLVQRIVLRHHGRIWAQSSPGQGATFLFSIPKGPRG